MIKRVTVLTNPASGHGSASHAAERAITQLGWRQVPAGQEMQRDELVHYAQTRRDALQAMVQGFETRQPLWFERSRSLQLQADNILLQMRLRRSLEAAGR